VKSTATNPAPERARVPARMSWKRDLAPSLEADRGRSLGQIASVVLPYLAVWILAAIVEPGPGAAIGLGPNRACPSFSTTCVRSGGT